MISIDLSKTTQKRHIGNLRQNLVQDKVSPRQCPRQNSVQEKIREFLSEKKLSGKKFLGFFLRQNFVSD